MFFLDDAKYTHTHTHTHTHTQQQQQQQQQTELKGKLLHFMNTVWIISS